MCAVFAASFAAAVGAVSLPASREFGAASLAVGECGECASGVGGGGGEVGAGLFVAGFAAVDASGEGREWLLTVFADAGSWCAFGFAVEAALFGGVFEEPAAVDSCAEVWCGLSGVEALGLDGAGLADGLGFVVSLVALGVGFAVDGVVEEG